MRLIKLLIVTLILQGLMLTGLIAWHYDQLPPAAAVEQKDPTPPDPNRPYYDEFGNQFTYDGKLINAACPNAQDNPYCVTAKSVMQDIEGK